MNNLEKFSKYENLLLNKDEIISGVTNRALNIENQTKSLVRQLECAIALIYLQPMQKDKINL